MVTPKVEKRSPITKKLKEERILREIKSNPITTPIKENKGNHEAITAECSSPIIPIMSPMSSSQPSSLSTSPSNSQTRTIRHAVKQSIFSIGINEKFTCQDCGMTYFRYVESDKKMHMTFHKRVMNGRSWSDKWGSKIMDINQDEYICCVNPKNLAGMKATIDLLKLVNHDLNAPEDNEFWVKGNDSGKVFVYVKDGNAIGVVSVERITRGTFLSVEDGRIAKNVSINLLAGINRIYVCKKYRRLGIALKLLQTLQRYFIYGMIIPKNKIAWSQPSFAGGKLATSFNGKRHKSGRILVPVYS